MKKKFLNFIVCLMMAATLTAQISDIKIIAYNIAMLSVNPTGVKEFAQPYQKERITLVPDVVKDYEIVIISEAFEDDRRRELNKTLGDLGFFHSCILGSQDYGWCDNGDSNGLLSWGVGCQDGGIIIYSKYPIIDQDQLRYYPVSCEITQLAGDACFGEDCYAKKGALYVRINKNGINFNVFGTHTQASYDNDDKYKRARKIQFQKLNNFINSKNIPQNEPIIIAGDLNVDMLSDVGEYNEMLTILNSFHPNRIGVNYTQAPQENSCLDHDHEEYLDYILFRNDHAMPYEATIETKVVAANYKVNTGLFGWGSGKTCCDISDHFPVTCFARFNVPIPVITDRDSDGIPDANDSCPDQKGERQYNGCTDTDGDGIGDNVDKCKDVIGYWPCGCPDCDGDGVTDDIDECPLVKGTKKWLGCPSRDEMRVGQREPNPNIQRHNDAWNNGRNQNNH